MAPDCPFLQMATKWKARARQSWYRDLALGVVCSTLPSSEGRELELEEPEGPAPGTTFDCKSMSIMAAFAMTRLTGLCDEDLVDASGMTPDVDLAGGHTPLHL